MKKENESEAKKKYFLFKFFNVIQLRGEKENLSLKAKKENKTIIAKEQQLQLKQKPKRKKQKISNNFQVRVPRKLILI